MREWFDTKSAIAMATGPTARKSAIAVIDQGLLSATNFITSYLLARACSVEEFGAYALAFSIMLGANALQTALVTGPMNVLGAPKQGIDWCRYFSVMAIMQVAMSGGLALLAGTTGTMLWACGIASTQFVKVLLAMSLALLLVQVQTFCRRVLFARMRTGSVLLNDAVFCGLQLVGLATLWWLDNGLIGAPENGAHRFLAPSNVFCLMAISAFVSSALGLLQLKDSLSTDLIGTAEDLRRTWWFGKWSLVNVASGVLAGQAITSIIGAFVGLAAVGALEASRLLVAPLQLVLLGVPSVLLPRAAVTYNEQGNLALKRFLGRVAFAFLIIFGAYFAMLACAPRFWLNMLYGSKYDHAVIMVLLWATYYLVTGIGQPPSLALAAMRRPDLRWVPTVVSGVLTVALAAVCTWWGGADWLVLGVLLGRTVGAAFSWTYAVRLLREPNGVRVH